jgi:integrase
LEKAGSTSRLNTTMKLDRKLTDGLARSVKLKASEIAWDGELAGFGVRKHPSGLRAWHVQYDAPGGRTRPMSLGPIEKLPASKARSTAMEILAKARLGQDPAAEKCKARDEAGDTFGGAHLKRYLEFKRKTRKPRTIVEIERHLTKDAATLHSRLIRQIDRKQAASVLAKIADQSGDRAADSVRASASAYFGWLMSEGLAEGNPFAGTVKRGNGKGRTRVPTLAELVEIWNLTDDDSDYAGIVRLLMLVGMRRNEAGGLQWNEVNLDNATITLPEARMKHNHEHVFMLPAAAVEILRSRRQDGRKYAFGRTGGTGFTGWSRALASLRARLLARRRAADPNAEPMPHISLHDFRRTVATIMSDVLDVPPHVVAEVLAHRTFKQGSEGIYNKGEYSVQKRAAIERWAAYLLDAVEGRSGQVVPLARPLADVA